MKPFGLLLALFILIPLLEFALLIEVGRRLGTLETLAIVFGTGLIGAYLARLEGLRIFYEIQRQIQAGQVPGEPLLDGLLVLVAAVVLITPGLLTDAAGLILLFPPTRYPVKAFLRRRIERAISRHRIRVSV